MNIKICRLDTSLFLNKRNIAWITQALTSFKKDVNRSDLAAAQLAPARAFAYYARAAYDPQGNNLEFTFDKSFIFQDKRGELKNPNTLSSWCRIMGFLYDDDGIFDLSDFAKSLVVNGKLTIPEICFVILSKQWVIQEGKCARNLLSVIYELTEQEESTFLKDLADYRKKSNALQNQLQNQFFKIVTGRDFTPEDNKVQFARFDALKNTLVESGILKEEQQGLSLTDNGAMILEDFFNREGRLSKYDPKKVDQKEKGFHQYMSAVENGVFDILSNDNAFIYEPLFPNIVSFSRSLTATTIVPKIPHELQGLPLQVIRYGAPGSGKSFATDKISKKYPTQRTTFHPDTDYSSFVGTYKPSSSYRRSYGLDAKGNTRSIMDLESGNPLQEVQVEYKFTKQVFVKAYIQAWKSFKQSFKDKEELKPQFLVIEEINRGNCAQIFGDIFQLLDRKKGFSEYPIVADEDIRKSLLSEDTEDDPSFGEYGLQLTLRQRAAINSIYDEPGEPSRHIADKICSGELLALPSNFYIYATMNTSDQSLFPMDSAFKRRWVWKYEAIDYSDAARFVIKIGEDFYPWDEFLMRINKKIASDLHSSAKQLGNRFVKVDDDALDARTEEGKYVITEENFINKVIFFLFSDAYKDDDDFGRYFFDKEEDEDGVWLFENLFDNACDKSAVCKNFLEHLKRDFNINDYLQSKTQSTQN